MQALQETDSVQHYIEEDTYTIGSLAESDGDEDLARGLEACLERIKKLQAAGIAVANEALKLAASHRRRRLKLKKVTDEFISTDQSFLKSPAGKNAKAVFTQTAAAVFALARDKFDETMDGVLARLKDRQHPLDDRYKDVAKRFVQALSALRAVEARQGANEEARKANSAAMAEAKKANAVEQDGLFGVLKNRHAGDPEEVELAFRPHPKKKPKKEGDGTDQKNAKDKAGSEQKTGTDGAGGSDAGGESAAGTAAAGDPPPTA